jgi:hypothetical protein
VARLVLLNAEAAPLLGDLLLLNTCQLFSKTSS